METTANTIRDVVGAEIVGQSPYLGMLQAAKQLRIEGVMSRDVLTASATDSIQSAAQKMSANDLSCLPIVDGTVLRGILTQEDVLKVAQSPSGSRHETPVTKQMRLDVRAVSPETSVLDTSRLMDAARIKWLPVLAGEQLVGVVTQSDVTRALTSLVRVIEVATIMSTEVASVDAAATVSQAASVMANERISCVLALHDDKLAGILTEKDVLKKVIAAGQDPGKILVVDVMSTAIVSVLPCCSLFSAHCIMDRKRLHRLVVMDGQRVHGVITRTDILRALKETLLCEEMEGAGEQEIC